MKKETKSRFEPNLLHRFFTLPLPLGLVAIAFLVHPTLAYNMVIPSLIWIILINLSIHASRLLRLWVQLSSLPLLLGSTYFIFLAKDLPWFVAAFQLLTLILTLLIQYKLGLQTGFLGVLNKGFAWSIVLALYLGASTYFWTLYRGSFLLPEQIFHEISAAPAPEKWTKEQKDLALVLVEDFLKQPKDANYQVPGLYEPLKQVKTKNIVVSLFNQQGQLSRGRSLATESAADQTESKNNVIDGLLQATKSAAQELNGEIRAIQIDVMGDKKQVMVNPIIQFLGRYFGEFTPELKEIANLGFFAQFAYEAEPGINGVEIHSPKGWILLLPNDPIQMGWWSPRIFTSVKSWAVAFEKAGLGDPAHLEINKFVSHTISKLVPQEGFQNIIRKTALFKELNKEQTERSILNGGRWLAAQIQDDGKFQYEYLPASNTSGDSYSPIRHAGSIYGLFHTAKWAMNSSRKDIGGEFQQRGVLGLQWLYQNIIPVADGSEDAMACFAADGQTVTSGDNALALLAFLANPDTQALTNYAVPIKNLQRCLAKMVDGKGKVLTHLQKSKQPLGDFKESDYYPGETFLALARHYQMTQEFESLELAERIGRKRIELYQEHGEFDHWVIQGLALLAELTQRKGYGTVTLDMAKDFIFEQIRPDFAYFPDEAGSFQRLGDVPRTTRSASRLEALAAAYKVTKILQTELPGLKEAMLLSAKHLVEQQFTRENSYFLPFPEKVLGAYPMGIIDIHCRIDNNQHALVGLIDSLDIFDVPPVAK